jgi:SOS-response transcriptional repressor LexA
MFVNPLVVPADARVGLTMRQAEVYRFVQTFIELKGYSPSYPEIAEEIGCNLSGVQRIAEGLEERGYIRRRKRQARSIIPI